MASNFKEDVCLLKVDWYEFCASLHLEGCVMLKPFELFKKFELCSTLYCCITDGSLSGSVFVTRICIFALRQAWTSNIWGVVPGF